MHEATTENVEQTSSAWAGVRDHVRNQHQPNMVMRRICCLVVLKLLGCQLDSIALPGCTLLSIAQNRLCLLR